jgi:hypothetical protein
MVEDLQSLKKVLQIISLFHVFAGLKLNKTKTEAIWLGKWRTNKDKPLGLKWVENVHSLGIFFSYNTDYVIQKNFTDKIKIVKKILDLWAQRNLSLIGKITILKSLAFSTLTYQCCMLATPENFLNEVNDIAYTFLWSNKPEKIKRKTIIADYSDGGLKMLDIKSFVNAQKIMWIKRLTRGDMKSWKAYPCYILDKLMGLQTFKCNLDITKNPNINEFYWSILKAWNTITEINRQDMTILEIRRQSLWLNKHIKVNKSEIKWKN